MDLPIATRIPSFENSFWIYLPANIITMEVTLTDPIAYADADSCTQMFM
jgi:hypothetical protein